MKKFFLILLPLISNVVFSDEWAKYTDYLLVQKNSISVGKKTATIWMSFLFTPAARQIHNYHPKFEGWFLIELREFDCLAKRGKQRTRTLQDVLYRSDLTIDHSRNTPSEWMYISPTSPLSDLSYRVCRGYL